MRLDTENSTSRRENRLVLQLNTGVGQAGRAFDAEIMNLSREGMLVKTQASLAVEEPFEVVLPKSGSVKAKVVWSDEGMYGCSFFRPLSQDALDAANDLSKDDAASQRRTGVDQETLGGRIKRLRTSQGHTMLGLADKVGVSKPTLWKWEGDQVRPRHETMKRLAAELGVSELELVYGAPGLGAAVALAEDEGLAGASLADIIRASRKRIAAAAGVDEDRVEISIDWGAD